MCSTCKAEMLINDDVDLYLSAYMYERTILDDLINILLKKKDLFCLFAFAVIDRRSFVLLLLRLNNNCGAHD